MNDLEQLKQLLFGAEKQALDTIAERVERPETRAADVADVLSEAVYKSHHQGPALVQSLTEPVGECVRQAFHDDPQTYSDALYPVLGPALRKSITQTLRSFAEQINQALEQSLTPRGLKWRWQAARAGVPLGEYVLQQTLLYRVEQAYLISRENGLLIEHAHHDAAQIKDSDAVSAMFTAIQDFVKESFSPDRSGTLESADMGEFTLWAVHGPEALLVCVIRGVPPKRLRESLDEILERIHFRHSDALAAFDGHAGGVPGVAEELQQCLEFHERQSAADDKRKPPWPLLIVAFVLLSIVAYLTYQRWQRSEQLAAFTSDLRATPGLFITETARDGERVRVSGLRDPAADAVAAVAARHGIAAESLQLDLRGYQSLDGEMVRRRAAQVLASSPALAFTFADARLELSGQASADDLAALRERLLRLPGIEIVDSGDVVDARQQALAELLASLDGQRFYFSEGTNLRADSEALFNDYVATLKSLREDLSARDQTLAIRLTGSADNTGTATANQRLARERADLIAVRLAAQGVPVASVRGRDMQETSGDAQVDLDQRYVQIRLAAVAAGASR